LVFSLKLFLLNEKNSVEGLSFWFYVLFFLSIEIVHMFQKKIINNK